MEIKIINYLILSDSKLYKINMPTIVELSENRARIQFFKYNFKKNIWASRRSCNIQFEHRTIKVFLNNRMLMLTLKLEE